MRCLIDWERAVIGGYYKGHRVRLEDGLWWVSLNGRPVDYAGSEAATHGLVDRIYAEAEAEAYVLQE